MTDNKLFLRWRDDLLVSERRTKMLNNTKKNIKNN